MEILVDYTPESFRNAANFVYRPILKNHCFTRVEKGIGGTLLILIPYSHWCKGRFRHKNTDSATKFAEISQNGVSLEAGTDVRLM